MRRVLAVLATVACGWVAYAVYGAAAQGHSLDDRVRDLGAQNAQLRAEIAQRRREISEAQDPAWLESEARRLDYVMPGERAFAFASPGSAVPPVGGVEMKQLPIFPTALPTPAPARPGAPTAPAPPPASIPTPAPPPPAAGSAPASGGSEPLPTPYTFSLPPPRNP